MMNRVKNTQLFFLITATLYYASSCSHRLTKYEQNNPFKCGWYLESLQEARNYYDSTLAPFQLQANDIVANVGSGSGWEECIWLTIKDSITFYAQDIDTNCMRKKNLENAIVYYSKLRGQPIISKIEIVIGNEEQTNLPDNFFDKILIISTYHEFSKPTVMLKDIFLKLKPNGKLLIKEPLANKKGDIHPICGMLLKTDEEMLKEIPTIGFRFQRVLHTGKARSYKGQYKIYEFEK